jgi:hypothetical protein
VYIVRKQLQVVICHKYIEPDLVAAHNTALSIIKAVKGFPSE